ncbi:Protein kinase-like domain protein [Niveomyces insectorum RCEF 264]|uniref:Protein kinase-like domain protein n=1 Tax=Niveomyces insectorum RCEF 264 TaxID=1081102 RepID=A0A167W8A4_9HYPO|nr:Protein kinase-like domain protein [Niveomyces insectorum RCEF 264]
MAATTPPESTFYPIVNDDLFNEHCIRANEAWQKKMLTASNIRSLEALVSCEMGNRRPVEFVTTAKGSYNLVLKFRIRDGATPTHVALRVPQRGYSPSALVSEKLENEVHWMQYFEEMRIAPVPHVYSWRSEQSSGGMDPYILMDFVEGENLNACWTDWEASTSEADKAKQRTAVQQLAAILLELSRPRFDKIGSITKAADGSWVVTQRPLTYDMYVHLSGIPDFPTDAWPAGPLQSTQEYKAFVAHLRRQQMMCLRNINLPGTWDTEGFFDFQTGKHIDMERAIATASGRVLSRRAMDLPDYAAHLNGDIGPFAIFCPDLSRFDILADPATGKITALLDLEFTNTMPAAFAQDPPLWHATYDLARCIERGLLSIWQERYSPNLDAFLAALEEVEAEHGEALPLLSTRMRESWDRGIYLINCALHHSEMTDILYHELPTMFPVLDPSVVTEELKTYQEHTMHQIAAYDKERVSLLKE